MAANTPTYAQVNPQSLLRDAMFDQLPAISSMSLAWPKIFGLPTLMGPGQIGKGRAIDMSNNGPLHGKLLVRNKKNLLGAAYTDSGATALSGATIGSARSKIDRWAPAEVAFTMKQFSGYASIPMHHAEHGFMNQAGEELLLAQRASASVQLQLEAYAANFFTGIGGAAGWTEIDWQAAATGGTDLDSSEDFMTVMSSVIAAARLRSASPINAMYCSRPIIEKLSREASVLSRVYVRNGGGAAVDAATENLRVGGFSGNHVMPFESTLEILKQHLGLDEIVVSGAMQEPQAGRSYVWPTAQLWIGTAGESAISLGAGSQPRLVSGAGAFCKLIGKSEVQIGAEAGIAPQNFEAVAEIFGCAVALDNQAGTIVKNLG